MLPSKNTDSLKVRIVFNSRLNTVQSSKERKLKLINEQEQDQRTKTSPQMTFLPQKFLTTRGEQV
jgi:hypothetical protein